MMSIPAAIGTASEQFLWYPGAIPGTDSSGRSIYCIALVTGRQASGAEQIEWVPVIESAEPADSSGSTRSTCNRRIAGWSHYESITRINRPR